MNEKKTWHVSGCVMASTYVGEYEAETGEEAIALAVDDASVSVCHQCARSISDPEVSRLVAECGDEVVEDAPADPVERAAPALLAALEAVARVNEEDGPCYCSIRIPKGEAHHLSCLNARAALRQAKGGGS